MYMRANDPQSGDILDPNVMIDMIYAQLHIRLLHTTYTSFENFSCMGPGAWLSGFIKKITI